MPYSRATMRGSFYCSSLQSGLEHGATTAYASRDFDAVAVVDVLRKARCTVSHGVPTMLIAILHRPKELDIRIDTLRTGIAAGSKVPPTLLVQLHRELGYKHVLIAYGK